MNLGKRIAKGQRIDRLVVRTDFYSLAIKAMQILSYLVIPKVRYFSWQHFQQTVVGLGFINSTGGNGADAAYIRSYSDGRGLKGFGLHPLSLWFGTTADGESTPTVRMKVETWADGSGHSVA